MRLVESRKAQESKKIDGKIGRWFSCRVNLSRRKKSQKFGEA